MIQYKLYRTVDETNRADWAVFSDVASDPETVIEYLRIEKKYIEVVSDVIGTDSSASFNIEFQFLHKLNNDWMKYYSAADLRAYKEYSGYSSENIYAIAKDSIASYIRLILREDINAIILSGDNTPLFGYINDFETIIYSEPINKNLKSKINKAGFSIKEISLSFEIDGK